MIEGCEEESFECDEDKVLIIDLKTRKRKSYSRIENVTTTGFLSSTWKSGLICSNAVSKL